MYCHFIKCLKIVNTLTPKTMEPNLISSSIIITALSSLCVIGLAQTSTQSVDLENAFKNAFEKYKQSVVTKNADHLKAAMAASAYMKMKNESIAHKLDFPNDFFEGMGGKLMANIVLQKMQALRAEEKNGTGILVMLAPKSAKFDPFGMGGDGDAHPMLITFEFIKEGEWKYSNGPSMEGIESADEANLLKGDRSKLEDDKYRPSGLVPPVPAQEAAPDYDYDAMLNIIFGDEAEVIINGKTLGKIRGSHRTGVKKGENTIVIIGASSGSKISLYARKDYDTEPVKVFELEEDKPEAVITKKFVVKFD